MPYEINAYEIPIAIRALRTASIYILNNGDKTILVELRHASEIVSGFVDNSWVTIVASDLSEGFARNIHSSLVYRRNKFNNAVASVVFTRTSNPNDEFSLKVMRESIKKNTHSYIEIGDEKKIRNTVFSKKGGDTETERMIYEIANIQNKFK